MIELEEDKKPFDKNGLKHGYWEVYDYYNGQLWYKGYFIHGNRYGYHELYLSGNLVWKGNYVKGNRYGYVFFNGCDLFYHNSVTVYKTAKNKFIL